MAQSSLWPPSIRVDARTPLAILRAQASELERLTKGVLIGDVTTRIEDDLTTSRHDFEVLAPSLGYARQVVTIRHHKDRVYPCGIFGEGVPGSPTAETQEKLEEILGKTFQSTEVVSILQSLIAQSNDVAFAVPPSP